MRWLNFGIFTAVLLAAQTVVAPAIELAGARPDWLLVVVIFLGLYAPKREALIGGWVIGVSADLLTLERFGFLAISYGLTVLLVMAVREYVFRYRASTQFVLTLVVGFALQTSWLVYRRFAYAPSTSVGWELISYCVPAAVYTAIWAPILARGFLRLSKILGIAHPRDTYGGIRRLERLDV